MTKQPLTLVLASTMALCDAVFPALCAAKRAEDLYFQDIPVVVTASRIEEKMNAAPGVIAVITKEEIQAFGAVNLVDVLNRAPSIQQMSSYLWKDAKPVIRGNLLTHADNQTLVLINGRPFRDANEGNSNLSVYKSFPIEQIERIEIVRGPGSVLYGSNALAGVINIITQKPGKERKVTLTGGGGSFGAGLGSATAYFPGRNWNLSLGANYFKDAGWKYSPATNHPTLGVMRSEMNNGQTDQSVTAFFDYNKRLTVQLFYSDVKFAELGGIPVWTQRGYVYQRRSFLGLGYAHPLAGTWDLKFNADVNGDDRQIANVVAGSNLSQKTLAVVFETAASGKLGDKTNLIVGGLTEKRANEATATLKTYDEDHYSAYIQADHQLVDALKVISGVQYNKTASGKSALVPRAGAIYDVNELIAVKTHFGQAFRTATPLEEYLNAPNALIGNSDLEPERVASYDAQVFLATSRSQGSLTYFYNQYTDLIDRVFISGGAGAQTFKNTSRKDIQGIELEEKTRLTESLSLQASATWQKEKDDTLFIPDYMVKGGLSYHKDNLTCGLFHSHFGKPKENSPLGGLRLNPQAKAINLLSLNVNYKFHLLLPMSVTFYGTNLLDDSMNYTEFSRGWVNTLPIGPGQAFYGKLSVDF